MELKGTKTEKNLMEAFAGECMARVKYEFFASKAKKDGYEQLKAVFEETSHNEKEHAKLFYKLLHGGKVGETTENLKIAAEGEAYENEVMYSQMAKEAYEEGFEEIGKLFDSIGKIEAHHSERYMTFLKNINDNLVFKKGEEKVWICRNCGHVYVGKEAPELCPVCAHPQAYFEILNKNY